VNVFGRAVARLGGTPIFALDSVVDFLSMDGDRLRSSDSKTNFVASDVDDRNHDVVPNHDALISVAGKDQHGVLFII
jgi:hypothetical protein